LISVNANANKVGFHVGVTPSCCMTNRGKTSYRISSLIKGDPGPGALQLPKQRAAGAGLKTLAAREPSPWPFFFFGLPQKRLFSLLTEIIAVVQLKFSNYGHA
jgi:hypothetical protein